MTTAVARQKVEAVALRRRVRSLIAAALGDQLEAAILFGSQARGDATEDSDWDVLVVVGEHADLSAARQAMGRIRGQLVEEAGEFVSILILRWSDADDHAGLLRNVARDGQRL